MGPIRHSLTLVVTTLCIISTIHAQEKVGINTINQNMTHGLNITSLDSQVIRLLGPGAFDSKAKLDFGDLSRVFIEEDEDDKLNIFGLSRTSIMGGNLGINTKTPSERLHVVGNMYMNQPTGDGLLILEADPQNTVETDNPMIEFRQDGGTTRAWLGFDNNKLGSNIFGINTLYRPGALKLDLDGNLGLNKVYPNVALNVTGKAGDSYLLNAEDSTGIVKFQVKYGGEVVVSEKLGVGTTTPAQHLTLATPTLPPVIRLERTDATRYDVEMRNEAGDLIFSGGADGVGSNLTDYMRIASDGRVGIGTTTASSQNLAAGHKLSVNGKIACTEVRVQPAASWPDYVFEKEYPLLSIDEVAASIAKNKHLPKIPSANEIETNGLEVGEMQRLMMEKIEELTLYIIQINEKVKELEVENSEMRKKLSMTQISEK